MRELTASTDWPVPALMSLPAPGSAALIAQMSLLQSRRQQYGQLTVHFISQSQTATSSATLFMRVPDDKRSIDVCILSLALVEYVRAKKAPTLVFITVTPRLQSKVLYFSPRSPRGG